jgi:hypothetical protein
VEVRCLMLLKAEAVAGVDARRLVAIALPVAMPIAMTAVFTVSRDRFGDHLGYVAGFGVYWGACAALAVGLLGRRNVRTLFRDRRPRLPKPTALGVALLVWPVAGAVATVAIPSLRTATPVMVVTAAGVALVNAAVEELLWRGVYITFWPRSAWLGWIWPAIGFGAWHMAPQVIHPSPMGPLAYSVAATVLGLSWGYVAWRTGSLRWTSVSHVFTDASGIRNSLFFLGS